MKIKPWKRLDSRVLLDNERLTVIEDKVALPNGQVTTYVKYQSPGNDGVAVIAINDKGEVLLQLEYNYPPNKILWQLPGGGIQGGESTEEAAVRELAEESGYTAKHRRILGSFYTNNRRSDQKQYVVLCTDLSKHKLSADPEEFITSQWVTKDKVLEMVRDGQFENVNLLAALTLWLYSSD